MPESQYAQYGKLVILAKAIDTRTLATRHGCNVNMASVAGLVRGADRGPTRKLPDAQ